MKSVSDDSKVSHIEDRRAKEVSMILEALHKNESSWHLDKKIPISMIIALLIQSSTIVWWASRTETRLNMIERANATERWVAEVSVRLDILQASVTESASKERMDYYVKQTDRTVNELKQQVRSLRDSK